MTLSAHNRREWLRGRYRDAQNGGKSLFQILDAESQRIDQLTRTGMIAVSTSGNGRSTTFDNRYSPQVIQELCSLAMDVYADAIDTLGIPAPADGDASQDENIFNTMMCDARFQRITGGLSNFMYLAK